MEAARREERQEQQQLSEQGQLALAVLQALALMLAEWGLALLAGQLGFVMLLAVLWPHGQRQLLALLEQHLRLGLAEGQL